MKKVIAFAVVGLVAAACSPGDIADTIAENVIEGQADGDVDVDIDSDDGTIEITGSDGDGDASITFGGGEIPDDFPFDLPGGGETLQVATSSDGNSVSLRYPNGDYDDLVDHFRGIYESGSAGDEDAVEFTSSNPPSTSFAWNTASGGFNSISISAAGDDAIVSIIYGDS